MVSLLQVGSPNLVTRYEMRNNGDGTASCLQTKYLVPTGDYAPHFIGSKGKTLLTDDEIAQRGREPSTVMLKLQKDADGLQRRT